MTDPLGPFQEFWEAWNEVDEEIRAKRFTHFPRAVEIQFEEMREHLANGAATREVDQLTFAEVREHLSDDDRRAAAREVVDVISIALNTLRWLRYEPEEIAQIARDRADRRMRAQTHEILDKYQVRYGI